MHYKNKIQNLQKLYDKTPESVVYFLSGSLPASALLHIKQLTLFSMIARLPGNVLHHIAKYILTVSRDSSKSWFVHIRSLTQQYHLPHPLTLLERPLSKLAFKKLVKSKVCDFWERKLRRTALPLTSLRYFHPEFMSLVKTHPLWTTCANNSFEVSKAIIQAKFLSGRYRTDSLLHHFGLTDTLKCALCQNKITSSLEHLLTQCSSLTECYTTQMNVLHKYSDPTRKIIINAKNKSNTAFVQVLLDPSVIPEAITENQVNGNEIFRQLFKFARTWCFNVHMRRMKLLGRWRNNL